MKLSLALAYTMMLITQIIGASVGNAPSWMAVFCPLIVLVMKLWLDYADEKVNGRKG